MCDEVETLRAEVARLTVERDAQSRLAGEELERQRGYDREAMDCIRRVLGVPDATDVHDHVAKVAHALADSLHPLAPWPPGWTLVEDDRYVALDLGLDGTCRAYVTRGPDEAYIWEWRESGGNRAGRAPSALTAIADCMARLEVSGG